MRCVVDQWGWWRWWSRLVLAPSPDGAPRFPQGNRRLLLLRSSWRNLSSKLSLLPLLWRAGLDEERGGGNKAHSDRAPVAARAILSMPEHQVYGVRIGHEITPGKPARLQQRAEQPFHAGVLRP